MDGQTDRRTDGQTEGQTDRRTDKLIWVGLGNLSVSVPPGELNSPIESSSQVAKLAKK
jgi:hypothetical protein